MTRIKSKVDELYERIKSGYNIKENDSEACIIAAKNGHLDLLKELKKLGANVNTQYDTPLRQAAFYGHLNVVQYLVEEEGADAEIVDNFCIRQAAANGHYDLVVYLTELGVDIRACNDDAIKQAKENKQTKIVKYLQKIIKQRRLNND